MSNPANPGLADNLVAVALSKDGLSFGTDPDGYTALLFPMDDPAQARAMARVDSSCGLFVRALLALGHVDGTVNGQDVLRRPYAKMIGQAISCLIGLAGARGVWQANPTDDDLQPGTVIHLVGPDHVALVTGRTVDASGQVTVTLEQGGGPDPVTGLDTAIHATTFPVQHGGGRLVIHGRIVQGAFDASALPLLPAHVDTLPPTDGAAS
jgi:hypothetical protein